MYLVPGNIFSSQNLVGVAVTKCGWEIGGHMVKVGKETLLFMLVLATFTMGLF
jgi:hypothetical protein